MRAISRLTYVIAAAAGLFTAGLMLYASDPRGTSMGQWAMILPFAVLALSPYLVLLAVALLVAGPAMWFYVQGFLVEPDAQSALLFVFLPIYQFILGAVAGMALWLLVSAARRWRAR